MCIRDSVRGALSRRDNEKVEKHLNNCRPCTAVYLELTEVNSSLAAVLGPVILGSAALAYLGSGSGLGAAAGLGGLINCGVQALGGNAQASAVAVAATAAATAGAIGFANLGNDGAGDGRPQTAWSPSTTITTPLPSPTQRPGPTHSTAARATSISDTAAIGAVPSLAVPGAPAQTPASTPPVPTAPSSAPTPDAPAPTPIPTPTPTPTTNPTSSPIPTPTSSPTPAPTSTPPSEVDVALALKLDGSVRYPDLPTRRTWLTVTIGGIPDQQSTEVSITADRDLLPTSVLPPQCTSTSLTTVRCTTSNGSLSLELHTHSRGLATFTATAAPVGDHPDPDPSNNSGTVTAAN